MEFRYKKILTNSTFLTLISNIEEKEHDRFFCRHGMEHLISVARIAYIISLEEHTDVSKDIIYAAALLHDIGRCAEYETGVCHNDAGAKIAEEILNDCGYDECETLYITEAIREHGHDGYPDKATDLEKLLCTADKLSRTCFSCPAHEECNWEPEKKNETLVY